MSTTIKTNNQPRNLCCLADFSPKQQDKIRADFDWLAGIDEDNCFFSYRGAVHHLLEFTRLNAAPHEDLHGWHGMAADSYFSGTLIKILDDGQLIVGRYAS